MILFLLAICGQVYAESKVFINEFAIEPNQSVELINNSSETIDISGWRIDDNGGTSFFTVPTDNILYPNTCLVFTSDFNLNKSTSDTVRLFDNLNVLVDSYSYNLSPGTGVSFLRLPDGANDWTTDISSLGKWNQTGENCILIPTTAPTPTSSPTPTIMQEPTVTPAVSYNNIFISEVMVAPESGNKEWIELYNDNDFPVSLTDWYIDDVENAGASPKSFSLTIPAKSYAVFDLSTSMFNNDGDSVRLLDSQKLLKDSLEYSASSKGKTLGRISFEDEALCLQNPTKGQENSSCIEEAMFEENTGEISRVAEPTSEPVINNPVLRTITPTGSVQDPTGSVLGFTTAETSNKAGTSPLAKPMSFLSLSYSILTIASILLKMKLNV